MLPRLKILMLLAMMVAKSLSLPPTDVCLPEKIDIKKMVDNAYEVLDLDIIVDRFKLELTNALEEDTFSELDQPISEFNRNLMKELVKDPENDKKNIFISPLSINAALAMLYYASPENTNTNKELAKVLSLEEDHDIQYLADYHSLVKFYETQKTGLELATKIFVAGGIDTKPDFIEFLQDFFRTSADNLDHEPNKAIAQINDYVKEKTKGMIQKILEPTGKKIEMVVVNALYYKDKWLYPFDPSMNRPMEFTLLDGSVVYPKGMWQVNEKLRIGKNTLLNSWILELPYENGFKMYFVLPEEDSPEALNEAVTDFDFETVDEFLDVVQRGVEVLIPLLEIEYDVDLAPYLVELGITEIFSILSGGDFRRMTETGGIRVNGVITKTKVVVNEQGAEAGASTCITMCTRHCAGPTKFLVNKPFGLYIVDVVHKVPVFSGKIIDPTRQGNPGASP